MPYLVIIAFLIHPLSKQCLSLENSGRSVANSRPTYEVRTDEKTNLNELPRWAQMS